MILSQVCGLYNTVKPLACLLFSTTDHELCLSVLISIIVYVIALYFVEFIVAFNPLMVAQTSVVEVSLPFYGQERRTKNEEESGELIEEVGAMQNEQ